MLLSNRWFKTDTTLSFSSAFPESLPATDFDSIQSEPCARSLLKTGPAELEAAQPSGRA